MRGSDMFIHPDVEKIMTARSRYITLRHELFVKITASYTTLKPTDTAFDDWLQLCIGDVQLIADVKHYVYEHKE